MFFDHIYIYIYIFVDKKVSGVAEDLISLHFVLHLEEKGAKGAKFTQEAPVFVSHNKKRVGRFP